jgi:hypothetical protein
MQDRLSIFGCKRGAHVKLFLALLSLQINFQTFALAKDSSRIQPDQRNEADVSKPGQEVGEHEAEGPAEVVGRQVEENRHHQGNRRWRDYKNRSQGLCWRLFNCLVRSIKPNLLLKIIAFGGMPYNKSNWDVLS